MGRLPPGRELSQYRPMRFSSPAFAALLAVGLISQSTLAAPVSLPMNPAQKWVLDYAESMCVLSRQYGLNGNQITLGFRPSPMDDYVRIAILGAERSRKAHGKAQIRFDGSAVLEAPYMSGPISVPGMYIVFVDTKWSELKSFETAKVMSIEAGKRQISLRLSGVPAAMKALKICEKDLLVSWGMDPKRVEQLATMPAAHNGIPSFFSNDDYPSAAIRDGLQGTTGVRFWVSKEGRVSDCRVVESSGTKLLDEPSCNIILRRGKFDPARTTSGEAIDSPAFTRIRWVLPDY
jgi:TonB family protein